MHTLRGKPKDRRGSILLLALFFMFTIGLMATAYMRLLPYRLQVANADQQDLQAQYVAEAGILNFCADLASKKPLAACIRQKELSDGWSFEIPNTLPPDAGVGGSSNPQSLAVKDPVTGAIARYYRIYCEAKLHDRVMRRSVVTTLVGPPLTSYTFAHIGPKSGGNKFAAFPYASTISGPVYCDGIWRVKGFDGTQHKDESGNNIPMVKGAIYATAAGEEGTPCDGEYTLSSKLPYTDSGKGKGGTKVAIDSEYAKLYKDGKDGINIGPEKINLTELETNSLVDFENASWGEYGGINSGTQTKPTSGTGIFANRDGSGQLVGGIYIAGSVDKMVLSKDGKDNPVTTMTFGSAVNGPTVGSSTGSTNKWQMVEVTNGLTLNSDASKNHGFSGTSIPTGVSKTVMVKPGSNPSSSDDDEFWVMDGPTNGVVYVSGSVNGVSGTIKGQKTIAAKDNLVVDGEILRYDTERGKSPSLNANPSPDMLGLAKGYDNSASTAMDIKISSTTADNKYYVYANLIGLGKADLEHNNGGNISFIPSNGKLFIKGQIVQGSSVPGHIKKFYDFFEVAKLQLEIDETAVAFPPPSWPTLSSTVQLKAYVDIPVSK